MAMKLFPVNVHLEEVSQLNHAGLWEKVAEGKTDKSQVGRDWKELLLSILYP